MNDDVFVYYNGVKYHYIIYEKYNIKKTGKASIIKSKEEKQVLSQYPVDNNQNRNELEQLSFEDLQMNNNGQSSNFEEKKPISNKIPPMIIVQIVLNIFSYVTTILMFMR